MITIKSEEEIKLMREAGMMVSKTHKYLKPFIKEGITTKELDKLAEDYIRSMGGVPTCKGYEGFPATLCTSINEEVVHGIPSKRKLKKGDIITVDMVIGYKGYQGDAAWTYAVGDISNAVQTYAEKHHLGVVKELVGHGIGTEMHEEPDVPNYGVKGTGPKLKPGMVICIEPMLNLGTPKIYLLEDDWTIITRDNKPAAHYEHTILVTEDGNEILTPRLD